MNTLTFPPNIPVLLSLADPEGSWDPETRTGTYQTVQGQVVTLPRAAVIKLNELEPLPGEEIAICRHWRGKPRSPFEWTVALSPTSEKLRAAEESSEIPIPDVSSPSELSERLERSITAATETKRLQAIKRPVRHATALEPNPNDLGTGTDGPLPVVVPLLPALQASGRRRTPGIIPYNVAFREVAQFVTKELNAIGEQWTDQAKQDLISTILIAAAKAGLLTVWERE